MLRKYFGIGSEKPYGLWGYEKRIEYANGVHLNYDLSVSKIKGHRSKLAIEIPGQALDILHPQEIFCFVCSLRDMNFKCSRIDLAFDDFERLIEPFDLFQLAKFQGDVSGFRRVRWLEDVKIGGGSDGVISAMCAFGRRGEIGSGKFLRVYDKGLESDGKIDAVRWEVEFSGKKAQEVFDKISSSNDITGLGKRVSEYIGGCVNFPIRNGDHHTSRLSMTALLEFCFTILFLSAFVGRLVTPLIIFVYSYDRSP